MEGDAAVFSDMLEIDFFALGSVPGGERHQGEEKDERQDEDQVPTVDAAPRTARREHPTGIKRGNHRPQAMHDRNRFK